LTTRPQSHIKNANQQHTEVKVQTAKTQVPPQQNPEKYESPDVVKMGKVVDLTHGNTGSSQDSTGQTIPVSK
jgi:transcription elongation GreA/GreB family factor